MVTNSFNSMIDRISAQQETTEKKTKTYSAFKVKLTSSTPLVDHPQMILLVLRLIPLLLRITYLLGRTKPVAKRLLAMVFDTHRSGAHSNRLECAPESSCRDQEENYGDHLKLKAENVLRIRFQNIGGLPISAGKVKDDFMRAGITKFDFDVFGLAEVNVNWRQVAEQDRLHSRSKHWWETNHLALGYNTTTLNRSCKQYGGVAMWTIGKVTHRISHKGQDTSGLGRWTWVRYRGKNNRYLRMYTAYRLAMPSGGPYTFYAQHRTYLLSQKDNRRPRAAFLEDICQDINKAQMELSCC